MGNNLSETERDEAFKDFIEFRDKIANKLEMESQQFNQASLSHSHTESEEESSQEPDTGEVPDFVKNFEPVQLELLSTDSDDDSLGSITTSSIVRSIKNLAISNTKGFSNSYVTLTKTEVAGNTAISSDMESSENTMTSSCKKSSKNTMTPIYKKFPKSTATSSFLESSETLTLENIEFLEIFETSSDKESSENTMTSSNTESTENTMTLRNMECSENIVISNNMEFLTKTGVVDNIELAGNSNSLGIFEPSEYKLYEDYEDLSPDAVKKYPDDGERCSESSELDTSVADDSEDTENFADDEDSDVPRYDWSKVKVYLTTPDDEEILPQETQSQKSDDISTSTTDTNDQEFNAQLTVKATKKVVILDTKNGTATIRREPIMEPSESAASTSSQALNEETKEETVPNTTDDEVKLSKATENVIQEPCVQQQSDTLAYVDTTMYKTMLECAIRPQPEVRNKVLNNQPKLRSSKKAAKKRKLIKARAQALAKEQNPKQAKSAKPGCSKQRTSTDTDTDTKDEKSTREAKETSMRNKKKKKFLKRLARKANKY